MGDDVTLEGDDTDPGPEVRHSLVHRHLRWQFADVEQPAVPAVTGEATRPVEVVELRQVVPLTIEDLHAMVLAIGDVHEALAIGGDVVRQVEAAGIGPGLAPGKKVSAPGVVLVHA